MKNRRLRSLLIGLVMFALTEVGWTQSDSSESGQASGTAGTASDTQDNSATQSQQNPPISGLDQASLGVGFPTRSFLVPGAHVSEALDTNVGQTAGTSAVNGVTRALGSLMLQ